MYPRLDYTPGREDGQAETHEFPSPAACVIGLFILSITFRGKHDMALENLALRQQLIVQKPSITGAKIKNCDRIFWIWMSRFCTGEASIRLFALFLGLTLGLFLDIQPSIDYFWAQMFGF